MENTNTGIYTQLQGIIFNVKKLYINHNNYDYI